ncbi:MAG: hypothetical protein ACD_79C00721G0003 [uncultured bacterium]|nr:MAG: hypothetical protein ACD_79C00721G0003 [uncultured bacterium]
MTNKNIILASKSPRRKEILLTHGFNVEAINPEAYEISLGSPGFDKPYKVVCENARRKAEAVPIRTEKWIISSDTIVILNNKEYGKPEHEDEAFAFLKELSGQTHEVYSSYCVLNNAHEFTGFDVSEVTFKHLSDEEIRNYIERIHVLDKAGAYAIQEEGKDIVEKLEGSYYTVMGLPIERIQNILSLFD